VPVVKDLGCTIVLSVLLLELEKLLLQGGYLGGLAVDAL
jgi:hypothetical protein